MADQRQWPAGAPGPGWSDGAPREAPHDGPWPLPQGWNAQPAYQLGPDPWWADAAPAHWYADRPAPGGPRLVPMTIGDLLDLTFRLFKANLRCIFPILVAVVTPWQVLRVLGTASTTNLSPLLSQLGLGAASGANPPGASTGRALALFASAGLILFQPLATGAVTRAVVARYRNDVVPGPLCLMRGGKRWAPSVLVASLLGHVLIVLGSVLFLVPGLILAVLWSLTAPVAATEGLGPWKALGRSWRLVSARGWRVMGNLLLGGVVVLVSVNLLSAGPVVAIGLVVHGRLAVDLDAIVSTLASAVQYGLYATLVALVYVNQRVRLEGLDLDALASLAAARA